MKDKIIQIERQSLTVGICANLFMAFSGWATFYLSGSEALLLDGNFSFILFLSSIAALKISAIKSNRSNTFPFGLFVSEALYSLLKGLLIGGVLLTAITANITKIGKFIQGEELTMLKTGPILIYSIAMVVTCFGLSLFYHYQNKRTGNNSSMLTTDKASSLVDGCMSAGTGAALVLIGYITPASSFNFLLYIGDAIMVLILATIMVKQPITIVKEAFIELAGGRLQNVDAYEDIESIITQQLSQQETMAHNVFISKTGSSYLVVLSFTTEEIDRKGITIFAHIKQSLSTKLTAKYPHIDVELVLS
ncbi:cation transporter [Photobacterium sanguinicancri]|uniref:Cation transporter n=1 Tax=Photobacterium sanguinicancri TaxID=875932 RepID=A0AAW7YBZ0_9GAMM|nr:cation transporter [Photobacterium sanguinicancri]MDO6544532.1 cation transporter [Photobacterium sanguinicancri]